MKKKTIILIVGLLLLVSAGGFAYAKFQSGKTSGKNTTDRQNNIFTSVKDALTQNLTLACEFVDPNGNTTKSYIKNGAVRVSMVGDDTQSGEIIIKDKKMYMWDNAKKEGFVYDIPDEAENDQIGMTNQDIVSSESYLEMINQYKDSCKVSSVEDSLFVAPKEVNFQDMSKFLKDLQSQIPSVQIPSE